MSILRQSTNVSRFIRNEAYNGTMAAMRFEMIVMGGSAGCMAALAELLPIFPASYPIPIVVAQHLHPLQDEFYIEHYSSLCSLKVKEADEKEQVRPGQVYFAPPNYHLFIENDHTFSLSIDEKVNYSRPSIDVLFESAADVYGSRLIGVVMTGANSDGSLGLYAIKRRGGMTIVQDPQTAESAYMPRAAIKMTEVDHILSMQEIGQLLCDVSQANPQTGS
jgi:two-component system chemotaxis response regulator CheB